MNAYADSLLTICLSWIKSVVRGVFNFFVSDQSHSFGEWLGDHWLSLVIMLCLAGTLIDFAVYLKRYKPYLLWGKKKPQIKSAGTDLDKNRFDSGFEDGVILETPVAPAPGQRVSYFDPATQEEEIYVSPFEDETPVPDMPYEDQPLSGPDPSQESPYPSVDHDWAPETYSHPPQNEQQPGYEQSDAQQLDPAYAPVDPAIPAGYEDDPYLNAPRLRRSDRLKR